MSANKTSSNFDKFTSYLTNIPSRFMQAHPLKRAYIVLWAITVVFLIATIAVMISYGIKPATSEIDTIAALAVIFVISLTAAIFATVFAQLRIKGVKLRKKGSK